MHPGFTLYQQDIPLSGVTVAVALLILGALAVRIWAEVAYRKFIARQTNDVQVRMADLNTCMAF